MENSINKSKQNALKGCSEMKTKLFEADSDEIPSLELISENIWKNTPGIHALFMINSSGKTLFSKFSKYFDDENYKQLDSVISSSCSSFTQSTSVNQLKISIGVFDKFTSMTSQIGNQFLVMIVPNNTSVGNSIQFAESLSSVK